MAQIAEISVIKSVKNCPYTETGASARVASRSWQFSSFRDLGTVESFQTRSYEYSQPITEEWSH